MYVRRSTDIIIYNNVTRNGFFFINIFVNARARLYIDSYFIENRTVFVYSTRSSYNTKR